ncbi:MAG: phosphotransferase [Dehalococcoidia bacterium]|nr:phosphotransferase [Dehalococcoidia bacterium]
MADDLAGIEIPEGPEAITAAWLTRVLHATGQLEVAARVAALEVRVFGADRGIGGQVARLTPVYEGNADLAPATLVAKLPSALDVTRGGGRFLRLPEREVRLYSELAPGLPLRTPHCTFAAVDDAGDAFVILMEDLGGARAGDDLLGVSDDDVRTAVRALARLHAAWWESPALGVIEWLPSIAARAGTWQRLFTLAWREVRDGESPDLYGVLPPGSGPVAELLVRRGAEVYERLARAPSTLLHGDFRLDNLFFDLPDGSPLAAIDWSNAMQGPGPYDLAYLLAVGLPPARRRALEEDLLASYLEGLRAGGVEGDLGWCRDAYRLAFLEPFMRMLFLLVRGHAEGGGGRPGQVLSQLVHRSAIAALDLESASLIEGAAGR